LPSLSLVVISARVNPLVGTFRAPPPGQSLSQPYDDKNLELGGRVEDLQDDIARKHFRVCIIRPENVEKLFLKDPTKAQRWRWTLDEASDDWKEEELWP
jgi:pyridoxamine 5'-phosphate oxidase